MGILLRYADKSLHASKLTSVLVHHTTLGMRIPNLAVLLPSKFALKGITLGENSDKALTDTSKFVGQKQTYWCL